MLGVKTGIIYLPWDRQSNLRERLRHNWSWLKKKKKKDNKRLRFWDLKMTNYTCKESECLKIGLYDILVFKNYITYMCLNNIGIRILI